MEHYVQSQKNVHLPVKRYLSCMDNVSNFQKMYEPDSMFSVYVGFAGYTNNQQTPTLQPLAYWFVLLLQRKDRNPSQNSGCLCGRDRGSMGKRLRQVLVKLHYFPPGSSFTVLILWVVIKFHLRNYAVFCSINTDQTHLKVSWFSCLHVLQFLINFA